MAEFLNDYLSIIMLATFSVFIFTGFPVAFLLVGVGIAASLVAILAGAFPVVAFYNISLRLFVIFS